MNCTSFLTLLELTGKYD